MGDMHISSPWLGLGLLIHQLKVNETHLTGSQDACLTYVIYRPCLGRYRYHVKWHPRKQMCDLGIRPMGALSVTRSKWGKEGARIHV